MRVFVCADHEGHYPVGVASVVVAPNHDEAKALLIAELKQHGLVSDGGFTLDEIDISAPTAVVLRDGDY